MRRLVSHIGLPAVIVGLCAVLLIAASSLILAVGYRNQLGGLRHVIYTRCLQRNAYDEASQQARAAQAAYFQRLIVNLHRHPTRHEFDVSLIRSARRVVAELDRALKTGAPTGCGAYR